MAKVIHLNQEVAKTMNDLRYGIPVMKKINADGRYDLAIDKDKKMYKSLLGSLAA